MADSKNSIFYIAVILALFSFSLSIFSNHGTVIQEPCTQFDSLKRSVEQQVVSTPEEISKLKDVAKTLMRTLLSYSTTKQQSTRSRSNSGISEVRSYSAGTQPYYQVLQTGNRAPFSIHNHANYRSTMGMGEFAAVLNGVEFWTRHNDYLLAQSNNSANYGATRLIALPPVPPSVSSKPTVAQQVAEMREYFRAWVKQDIAIRDYRPYFKAVLCYLEGGFIVDSKNLVEPFESDRHFIDAATWKSLNDKNRFLFASGRKNTAENIPYLPSVLHDIITTESYVLKNSNKPLTPKNHPDSTPAKLFSQSVQTIVDGDKLTVYLAQTSKGLYLNLVFGKLGSLQSGGATVGITCNPLNNTGCQTATAPVCVGATQCNSFSQGTNTNLVFSWNNPTESNHPGLVYGPLRSSCFSVSISVTGATGVSGYVVRPNSAGPNITGDFSQPIVIEGCVSESIPVLANWEYRVICKPIEKDVPLNRLRVVDDTAAQMSQNPPLNSVDLATSRNGYFQLNPEDKDFWTEGCYEYEWIDELMETIPGRNNEGAVLEDRVGGEVAYHIKPGKGVLNTAYYSRFYSDSKGNKKRRGFNDKSLWAAMTTQAKVAELGISDPLTGDIVKQKWTYAVPLEIVYTTPLSSWNPYNFAYYDRGVSTSPVVANGRNGGLTADKAYNGTAHEEYFFWTPSEFFSANDTRDAADTSGDVVGVLDPTGTVRNVRSSGHWVTFPEIIGVGKNIRQRYPIAPLSTDKNVGLMSARALKHLLATNQKQLLDSRLGIGKATLPLWSNPSTIGNRHIHRLNVIGSDVDKWNNGVNTTVTISEQENGHTHQFTIRRTTNAAGAYVYTVIDCDGVGPICPDGHTKVCIVETGVC